MTEYSPGLEGVVAAQTAISEVDGANGRLIYRGGYLIEDIAPTISFEETSYLLWNGELPNRSQLDALRQEMAAARKLKDSTRSVITSLDYDTDPMDVLRTAISAQGAAKTLQKPTVSEAIALTAVIPTIVAAAHRRRHKRDLVEYLVLLADHGLNASTFTARVVASTGSDLTSCVVGAIAALKGPAHGGATYSARTMLDSIGSIENVEKWLADAHAKHARFPGFGHRVYRTYDPRAKILREMAKTADPKLHQLAAHTEEVALKILHEAHPERPNATNVDFWASVVLTGAGIPKELFTCMFATSRVAGWTAHVLESLADLRIIRPASQWMGPEPGKKPVPLDQR